MEAEAPPESIRHVTSADGSSIGFEVVGSGPSLLLVHTMAIDRTQFAPIKDLLAGDFTLHLPDRRGYGLNEEVPDDGYSLDREAEDLAAVVEAIGEDVLVWGHSYGGVCVLEAAARGVPFKSILADDIAVGGPNPPVRPELTEGMARALEAGDRDSALEQFLRTIVGLNDEQIGMQRGTPFWETRAATIHLFVRDALACNHYRYDPEDLAKIKCPVRFVFGQESPPIMREGTEAAHNAMPGSELTVVEGRLFTTMYTDPESAARQVRDWFLGDGRQDD
jgi:pimeloyl-ACP methyl ester carboxylesterase